jgi:hypothetical protein
MEADGPPNPKAGAGGITLSWQVTGPITYAPMRAELTSKDLSAWVHSRTSISVTFREELGEPMELDEPPPIEDNDDTPNAVIVWLES